MTQSPAGWASATLEDVAEWSSGGTPKAGTAAYYGEGVPWAIIGDLTDGLVIATAASITEAGLANSSAKVVPAGTVLVAMYGSIGKLGIAGVDMATNQAIACARPLKAVTREWLFWWLRYQRNDLLSAGKGGTQANISQTVLKAWPIPVAPLSEQERIVSAIEEALSLLDAGEAGLHATRTRLKRMRDSVLAAAVTGQLVPQHPTDPSVAASLAQIGGDVLETAGLTPIPPSWRWALVKDVGKVDLGRQRHPDWHTGPNMKPYLRVANVFEDRIDTSDVMQMHFEPDVFERFRLVPGDVLLNEGQTPELLGRPALYRGEPPEVAFTNSILRFKSSTCVLPTWALLVFRAYMRTGRFTKESRITTNIAHLSAGRLKEIEFPVPPIEEQARIVAEVERQFSFIEAAERAVSVALVRSAGLRRSVLKAAFEGQLVPQDPSDEPASVLLERIAAERAAAPKVPRRGRAKVEAS